MVGAEESFWQGGPRESLTQQNSPPPSFVPPNPTALQPDCNLCSASGSESERETTGWMVRLGEGVGGGMEGGEIARESKRRERE